MTFKQTTAAFQNTVLGRLFSQLNPSLDPRFLIVITNAYLELFVQALIEARCKNADKIVEDSHLTHSVRLIILHELELISNEEFAVLNWVRKLRNDAAHKALFDVPKTVVAGCPKKNRPGDAKTDLAALCLIILTDFVFEHNDVSIMATSEVSEFDPKSGRRKKK